MTILIERSGDIFTTTASAVGHGVNTVGVMGAGIARQFRDRYPVMFEAYWDCCLDRKLLPGECMAWDVDDRHVIYNIASQDAPGANARLEWLTQGVQAAVKHAEQNAHPVVALPQIGCGIGGLVWADVLPELRVIAESSPVDVEAWTFTAVQS